MPRGAPPSAWIGARPPNKPASGGEAKAKALPMRGSVASKRKARPGVANGSIRGAVAAQAVEEENHSPASGGDTQIAQPKPKRRGRPSSPDSASKSESSAPEGTSRASFAAQDPDAIPEDVRRDLERRGIPPTRPPGMPAMMPPRQPQPPPRPPPKARPHRPDSLLRGKASLRGAFPIATSEPPAAAQPMAAAGVWADTDPPAPRRHQIPGQQRSRRTTPGGRGTLHPLLPNRQLSRPGGPQSLLHCVLRQQRHTGGRQLAPQCLRLLTGPRRHPARRQRCFAPGGRPLPGARRRQSLSSGSSWSGLTWHRTSPQ